MKTTKDLLAFNLRRIREARGMTQLQLAEDAELSLKMIQKLEYSQSSASAETIDAVAKALSVDVVDLFGGSRALPVMAGGVNEAIQILSHLEALDAVRQAVVLTLLFRDERYVAALKPPRPLLQALRTIEKEFERIEE